MPMKTKAKDHSEYMKHVSHIKLHNTEPPKHSSNSTGKIIIVVFSIILIIIVIFLSLVIEA